MKTIMYTILISSIMALTTVCAQSWNPLSSLVNEHVIVIGIDRSSSINEAQRVDIIRIVQTILEKKTDKNDLVFVLPIHANTASAAYLALEDLTTKKKGRAGKAELKRKKESVLNQIKEGLAIPIKGASNATDIIGFWAKVNAIESHTSGNMETFLISDMIHETRAYDFDDMIGWYKSNELATKLQISGVKPMTNEIPVSVIHPNSAAGSITQEFKHLQKQLWDNWFTTINVRIVHWDSDFY